MSNVYNKHGKKIKTYDKYGNETAVISTVQAAHEWAKQYKATLQAERIAILEAVVILGLIVEKLIHFISPWRR